MNSDNLEATGKNFMSQERDSVATKNFTISVLLATWQVVSDEEILVASYDKSCETFCGISISPQEIRKNYPNDNPKARVLEFISHRLCVLEFQSL